VLMGTSLLTFAIGKPLSDQLRELLKGLSGGALLDPLRQLFTPRLTGAESHSIGWAKTPKPSGLLLRTGAACLGACAGSRLTLNADAAAHDPALDHGPKPSADSARSLVIAGCPSWSGATRSRRHPSPT
jgi:hypothetical protein